MSVLLPRRNFASLSVKDLLDAREAYHVHLLNLEHVVATAIGRYRFVRNDPNERKEPLPGERGRDVPRTLANSEIRDYSWPCVMVFVNQWLKTDEFAKKFDELVPPRLYLPDGRVVPTCVVLAEPQDDAPQQTSTLRFPHSMLGGGYPSIAEVQGETRFATIGCLVSDGDTTYALTNLHVAGEEPRALFTLVNGSREQLGLTAGKHVGKIPFEKAYPGFTSPRSVVNLDAALIKLDDLSRWTSQVYGIGATPSDNSSGQFDELADINVDSVNLDLIGCEVRAFGAASGLMSGEIQGIFYRYRSVGGQDQLADLLIGPPAHATPKAQGTLAHQLGRHGNSGAVWFLVEKPPGLEEPVKLRPIALHWGGQTFVAGDDRSATQFGLASSLGVICRELGVEVVRTINVGLPQRWGQVGHYKAGQLACELVTDLTLKKLLKANIDRISFKEEIDQTVASVSKDEDFIPLADVSDLVWKSGGQSVRGREGPNHFADMDQPSDDFDGKTLLQLSETDAFLDPVKWNAFYESLGVKVGHRGLLPFRVWQLFDEMVSALSHRNLTKYIAAAGVLAHYAGDACQPLHASMFHDGDPETGEGEGVHTAYETTMLNRFAPDLNTAIANLPAAPLTRVDTGRDAAKAIVKLMTRSIKAIPPKRIIKVYEDNGHKVAKLWENLGVDTAKRIHDGATTLAAIWQGAWKASGISGLEDSQLRGVSRPRLRDLYLDKDWAPSMYITHMRVENGELVIDTN